MPYLGLPIESAVFESTNLGTCLRDCNRYSPGCAIFALQRLNEDMLAVFARHFQICKRIARNTKDICRDPWNNLFLWKSEHSHGWISADDFGHRFFSDDASIPGSDGHVLNVVRGISNDSSLDAVAQIE